jgi:rod shape-determining protein MreD
MAGSQPTHSSRRILRPARPAFIVFSLFIAYCLSLVPFGKLPGVPDWVALTLAFWSIHQPLRIGMGAGFVLGLAVDISTGGLLGQHALAYVLLGYVSNTFSRRILWFPLIQQTLHIFPLMLATQLIIWLVAAMAGRDNPSLWWLLSSLTSTLLWTPATFVLLAPQYQPESKDVHRPI